MRKLIVVATVAASLLLGCDQKSTGKRETLSEALVAKSLSNMVPVKGGEFLMGDFGPLVGEKLPFSINQMIRYYIRLYSYAVWSGTSYDSPVGAGLSRISDGLR